MKPLKILATGALLSALNLFAADTYTVAVIPKGSTHEHWKTVHAGAVKAQRELEARGVKVDVMWQAPLREDDRDYQIRVVENLIARKVSGICIAPLDSKALVPPINTATRAKIPIIVFDSAVKSDKPISYIATDNYKGGVLGAEHLGKLLAGLSDFTAESKTMTGIFALVAVLMGGTSAFESSGAMQMPLTLRAMRFSTTRIW